MRNATCPAQKNLHVQGYYPDETHVRNAASPNPDSTYFFSLEFPFLRPVAAPHFRPRTFQFVVLPVHLVLPVGPRN